MKKKFTKYDFGIKRPQNIKEFIIEYILLFYSFLQRKRLDKFLKLIKEVDNIILGNYLKGHKDYMRHIPNNLTFKNVIIIDDGTDTILINREREVELYAERIEVEDQLNWLKKSKSKFRKKYIDWNVQSPSSLTFFSCYDLCVANLDKFIKNEYLYLRKISKNTIFTDNVIFLGQCLVDDGYITIENYKLYISKIISYFNNYKFVYVPHPRESEKTINYLKEALNIEIKKYSLPIEYEMAFGSNAPKFLSSFFCSALENCFIIMGKKINIKSFYISQEHLIRHKNSVMEIYEYFESKIAKEFEVIKLDI